MVTRCSTMPLVHTAALGLVVAFASACATGAGVPEDPGTIAVAEPPPSDEPRPPIDAPRPVAATSCTPTSTPAQRASGFREIDFTGQEWAYGPRFLHTASWDGRELLVYGGAAASVPEAVAFDPGSGQWTRLPDSGLPRRVRHVGVWTGSALLVWGGETPEILGGEEARPTALADGAIYDPCAQTWRAMSPSPVPWRRGSSAVWSTTTEELLVWGGLDAQGTPTAQGFAYRPDTATWRTISSAPLGPRTQHAAVWIGDRMMVWGGLVAAGDTHVAATYDPAHDAWSLRDDAPSQGPRGAIDVAIVDGARAILWGGTGERAYDVRGVVYDATTSTFRTIPAPMTEVLTPRHEVGAFVGRGKLWLLGGHVLESPPERALFTAEDGASFDLETWTWTHLPRPPVYALRESASATWTGVEAVILGGSAVCTTCNPLPPGGEIFRP
jgi:hypothetical protein